MELSCKLLWIFATFWYTSFCSSPDDLPFMIDPSSEPLLNVTAIKVKFKEGSKAELPCPIKNKSKYDQISWHTSNFTAIFNDHGISKEYPRFEINITNVTTNVEEWNLIINQVETNDAGEYHCMLNIIPPQMKSVRLLVLVPASIDRNRLKDHYGFQEGNRMLNVTCPVQGDPVPTVHWYRFKANNLTMMEEKELIAAGKHLVLQHLTLHDEGIYRCEAHNSEGDDMYEIYLIALYKPMVKIGIDKVVVKKYETAILYCEAEGNPAPKIEWHRKSAAIGNTSKYKIVTYAESETHKLTELIIDDAHIADDGEYVCVAHNSYGQDQATILLHIPEHTTATLTTRSHHTHHPMVSKVDTPAVLESSKVVISTSPNTATAVKSSTLKYEEEPRTEASKNGCGVKEIVVSHLCLIFLIIAIL